MTMPNHKQELLNSFNCEVFPHLAPSDFHLFQKIKNWVATQYFDDDEEL
jgi:hypothetical protein